MLLRTFPKHLQFKTAKGGGKKKKNVFLPFLVAFMEESSAQQGCNKCSWKLFF